ncbi:thiamine ABC transporter substrate-binding protein [Nocardioides sp. C4-1]|uniref:thiamine ABC transporter substrate-binding protein n=1 Tax=Nocardioides sp. C4-1 TaxID=3151851 RepID=UPI003264DFFE
MRHAWSGVRASAVVVALAAVASSCSALGGSSEEAGDDEVVLVVHNSFALPDELIADFEQDSGLTLTIRESGDAGELTNKLVLTKSDPIGDVAFGVDNAFASRALEEGVFETNEATWPAGVDAYALDGDLDDVLAPVDNGNVCVNVDTTYFEERGLQPPTSLADLADARFKNLFVTPSAATSSPGLAFLLATIAQYGDEWPAYWDRLMANGTRIASSWTDAYQVDFTQGGGSGDRPVVTSYDSSPAFTVPEGGTESTTAALLDTCFLQVEYAGVLTGAANPGGAREVIEWLLSAEVQAALPESMYVFPTRDGVELPAAWASYAVRPTDPKTVDPAEIAGRRDAWLQEWTEITTR